MKNCGSEDFELLTKKPYVRCNGKIPNIPENHSVTIIGSNKEMKWDVYSLMRFNNMKLTVCMECAGNSRHKLPYEVEGLQWDNRAVSNVVWTGIQLKELLIKIPQDTKEIVFTSLDNEFTRSLPIHVIYERPVILAYRMNCELLSAEHGAPIRLIVPGWYGMASVKWLDKIYFSNKPFEGLYQTEKYNYKDKEGNKTPVSLMFPKSLITSVEVQNPVIIKGRAWSGHPISKVEIMIDSIWIEADIVKSTGEYGWFYWQTQINLSNGKHVIASRATDITGTFQPDQSFYNYYGYANNKVQSLEISV